MKALHLRQRLVPLQHEVGSKADAVFQLREAVVPFGRRKRLFRQQIKLVTQVDKRLACFLTAALLPCGHLLHNLCGLLLRKGSKLRQVLAVLSGAYGNNRHRQYIGILRVQIVEALGKNLAVIITGTADNLCMHLNARIEQKLQALHQLTGKTIVHHLAAHLRVGSVYRNIQRRKMRADNTFKIFILHIGECNEVTI